jgi:hypothetical protein
VKGGHAVETSLSWRFWADTTSDAATIERIRIRLKRGIGESLCSQTTRRLDEGSKGHPL